MKMDGSVHIARQIAVFKRRSSFPPKESSIMSSNINVASRANGHLNGEAGAHFAASGKEAIREPAPGLAINKRARPPKAYHPEIVPPPGVSEPERGTEQPSKDNGQQEGIRPKNLAEVIEA